MLLCECGAGDGGGVVVETPTNGQAVNIDYCSHTSPKPPFLEWQYNDSVVVSNCVFANNSAACRTCSGGGLVVGMGAEIAVLSSQFDGNTAGLFGGGALFGGVSAGSGTCSVRIGNRTRLRANVAKRGGSQLYMNCAGALTLSNATVMLGHSEAEVPVPLSCCGQHAPTT